MTYKRLKELRKDHNMTQKEIADYLECNPESYARYERGNRKLPLNILIKLADLYNISADYIIERTDIKEIG